MHPVLFQVPLPGGAVLPIGGFGLFAALAVVVCVWVGAASARRVGLTRDAMVDFALCLIAFGIVGSKLLQVALEWDRFAMAPLAFLRITEIGVWYGGLLGVLAMAVRARMKGWSFAAGTDALAPGMALAHGFARVGCFLGGCCYGVPSSTFGVSFPATSSAYQSLLAHDRTLLDGATTVPLFPVQLLEAGFEGALCIALALILHRGRARPGVVGALYFTCYAAFRFLVEGLRADPERGSALFGAVTTTQLISVAVFAVGLFLVVRLQRRPDAVRTA